VATQAWSAYLAGPGKAERPGDWETVSAIDVLDDQVDLTPARHIRPARGIPVTEPRDLLGAVERIGAALGALAGSLPILQPASPAEASKAWVTVDDLVRSGAVEIHRPSPQPATDPANQGSDRYEVAVTSQDIVQGTPPSGVLPLGPRDADTTRVLAGDILIPTVVSRIVARVATDQQVGAVVGRGVHVVRVDPGVVDPWFLAGAITGADSSHGVGHATSTISGILRVDVRRLQVPVLSIETQRRYGNAHRRLAEFETLVHQAADRSYQVAQELASGLVNGVLEPAAENGEVSSAERDTGEPSHQ
jgi:hypothetical protein